jgi:5-methylcytosine-specific restriction endonuclease McrA
VSGAAGTFTLAEWDAIKARYEFSCLACGAREPEITLHADHIEPLAVGGSHTADNIQPLCNRCNARKGAQTIDYRPSYKGARPETS